MLPAHPRSTTLDDISVEISWRLTLSVWTRVGIPTWSTAYSRERSESILSIWRSPSLRPMCRLCVMDRRRRGNGAKSLVAS